jgi:transcriptional regulator with XRE-family HTH domain
MDITTENTERTENEQQNHSKTLFKSKDVLLDGFEALKGYINIIGWSEFSKRANISKGYISDIFHKKINPSIKIKEKLAQAFNISYSKLDEIFKNATSKRTTC